MCKLVASTTERLCIEKGRLRDSFEQDRLTRTQINSRYGLFAHKRVRTTCLCVDRPITCASRDVTEVGRRLLA